MVLDIDYQSHSLGQNVDDELASYHIWLRYGTTGSCIAFEPLELRAKRLSLVYPYLPPTLLLNAELDIIERLISLSSKLLIFLNWQAVDVY